jgi:hypothetical protein
MHYRSPIKIMYATRLNDVFRCDIRSTTLIGMCFSYTAEYLTTHRDFYLHAEQVVFCFLFSCKQWGSHPPKEHISP